MRKHLAPTLAAGILAVFVLFLPSKSHAVPLDVPNHGGAFTMTGSTGTIVLSSVSLPTSTYGYQWCLEHVVVSAPTAATFTMYVSTMNTLTPSTTNYVVVTSTGVPYDMRWDYRTPYCAPVNNYLVLTAPAGSTMTVEGYPFGGWSNP